MNINQYRAVQAYVDVQLAYMALCQSDGIDCERFAAIADSLDYADALCRAACEGAFAKAGDPPRRRGRGGAL